MRSWIHLFLSALIGVSLGLATADADTITATDTLNAVGSYTTGDGLVTLHAFSATDPLTPGSFNDGTGWIGVFGGNGQSIDNTDGDPTTGGDGEAIDMVLDSSAGLSQMLFEWSRADGPSPLDGIQIAGFASDPGAVVSSGPPVADLRYDAGSSSVFLEVSGSQWGAGIWTLDLADLNASAGQTLRVTVNDSAQAGPVASIVSMSYEVIPEPSTLALLVVGAGLGLARRRH